MVKKKTKKIPTINEAYLGNGYLGKLSNKGVLYEITEPNYADQGVSFSGQAKQKVGVEAYQFVKQNPFIINFGRTTGATLEYYSGKIVRVTAIVWNQDSVAGMGASRVRLGSLTPVTEEFEFMINDGSILTLQKSIFNPSPLVFQGLGLRINNGWNGAAAGSVECNVIGWWEEPPT